MCRRRKENPTKKANRRNVINWRSRKKRAKTYEHHQLARECFVITICSRHQKKTSKTKWREKKYSLLLFIYYLCVCATADIFWSFQVQACTMYIARPVIHATFYNNLFNMKLFKLWFFRFNYFVFRCLFRAALPYFGFDHFIYQCDTKLLCIYHFEHVECWYMQMTNYRATLYVLVWICVETAQIQFVSSKSILLLIFCRFVVSPKS